VRACPGGGNGEYLLWGTYQWPITDQPAPDDGFGHINLTREQLQDEVAFGQYARMLIEEES
jgi:hypothetical protein